MVRKAALSFFGRPAVFLAVACGAAVAPVQAAAAAPADAVARSAEALKTLIAEKRWAEAEEMTARLQQAFKRNLWKYQLLGDEEEYESLEREINGLQAAVSIREAPEAMLRISGILSIVKSIYSL